MESYGDNLKTNGGWSIELIDLGNPCKTSNYGASVHTDGGTPGKTNSIIKLGSDVTKPRIEKLFIKSDSKIILEFTESLDSSSAVNLANYTVTNNSIRSIVCLFETVEINFSQPIIPNTIYDLELKGIMDCTNNYLMDTFILLILPEKALPGELIINEILFNPVSGGTDFIEIYNPSDKIISLKHLTLPIGYQKQWFVP